MSEYMGLPSKLPSRCTARCRQGIDWKFSEYDDAGATEKIAVFTAGACARCGQRPSPQRIAVPLDWQPVVAEPGGA